MTASHHRGVHMEDAMHLHYTLVGRAEERDLIDVMFLEGAGYSVEAALPGALAKDGGCTRATLARARETGAGCEAGAREADPAVKPAPVAASGGSSDNRSGLGDGTNPGNGAGKSSSPNQGKSNPSQASKPAPVAVDIKKK